MAVYTGPGPLTAAFLISEANGMYRSREEVDVDGGEAGLDPGTLLKAPAGAGQPYTRAAAAETPVAILWEGIPTWNPADGTYAALANVKRRTVVVRDAEVHKTELIYGTGSTGPQIAAADTALRALGIIPRL